MSENKPVVGNISFGPPGTSETAAEIRKRFFGHKKASFTLPDIHVLLNEIDRLKPSQPVPSAARPDVEGIRSTWGSGPPTVLKDIKDLCDHILVVEKERDALKVKLEEAQNIIFTAGGNYALTELAREKADSLLARLVEAVEEDKAAHSTSEYQCAEIGAVRRAAMATDAIIAQLVAAKLHLADKETPPTSS